MSVTFTAHNIRLADGRYTKPDMGYAIEEHPYCVGFKRTLNALFPGDRSQLRLVDLGCLEGGYSVEFARMGFQVLGIDVRESNIAACSYVKSQTQLPNLEFVQDNAWNAGKYGPFDVVFCCGLLYHLEEPKRFLEMLSASCRRVLLLQTHFSHQHQGNPIHSMENTPLVDNEGLPGRWYVEFSSEKEFEDREQHRWSSWDNRRSFWIQKEYLLQTLSDVGFDCVFEQYDTLGDIAKTMTQDDERLQDRSTFVAIKV